MAQYGGLYFLAALTASKTRGKPKDYGSGHAKCVGHQLWPMARLLREGLSEYKTW